MTSPAAALPASSTPSHGQHALDPGAIAIGVIIARTSEFFDFFVYAIASVLVFPRLVFPHLEPVQGTLWSFAIFALAFLARPVGTAFFTLIERRYGRGVKMTIALVLLGGSTAAIAFLPGYAVIGASAPLLLALFRCGQGFAVGGEWDGTASLLSLHAPEKRRGWYAMIPQLGAPIGLAIASGLFAYFLANLSSTDFFDWGWRYPFFVAFVINVVALFARLRMVEAAEYKAQFVSRELEPSPIIATVRHQGLTIIAGAFAPLASFALFHMVTVFPLSWVFLYTSASPVRFLLIEIAGAVIGAAAIVASGVLADRFGRARLLIATACAIAAYSGFAPQLLAAGEIGEVVFVFVGFAILGLSLGQSSGALAAGFRLAYRYTGSALTADLAWLFGAGFAPLVALLLASNFGLIASGAYLLSGSLCTIAALALTQTSQPREG